VGGHRIIKMDKLREMFSALGFSQVKSYIQSGNIIFETAESDGHALERRIEAYLQATLGYEVATVIRTVAEMADIVRYDPFQAERSAEGVKMYVSFLADEPNHERKNALMSLSNDIELFQIKHRELFYLCRPTTKKVLFSNNFIRHYTDLMIFVGAGLVPAHNGGKHKALPLQNVNDFLIGINSIEKELCLVATTRNWATVNKIVSY